MTKSAKQLRALVDRCGMETVVTYLHDICLDVADTQSDPGLVTQCVLVARHFEEMLNDPNVTTLSGLGYNRKTCQSFS